MQIDQSIDWLVVCVCVCVRPGLQDGESKGVRRNPCDWKEKKKSTQLGSDFDFIVGVCYFFLADCPERTTETCPVI